MKRFAHRHHNQNLQELLAEGVVPEHVPHRTFKGNRPSLSILMPRLNAYTTGQLLALYEHRTAVQGFVWHVNSFDQVRTDCPCFRLSSSVLRKLLTDLYILLFI